MNKDEFKEYNSHILNVVVMILILLFGGTVFYNYVENWNYLDSLYFSVATLTTVGYGDIAPQTNFGKAFTIIYIIAGVAVALYGFRLLDIHFIEVRGEFWLKRLIRKGNIFGKIREIVTFGGRSKKKRKKFIQLILLLFLVMIVLLLVSWISLQSLS